MLKLLTIILIINAITNCAVSIKTKRSATGSFWPENTIAYSFSDDFESKSKDKIVSVLKSVETQLKVGHPFCIEFTPLENQTDYILFVDNGDCSSEFGYSAGVNQVSLSRGCLSDAFISRQILHVLGFGYEHLRLDRDQFIDVEFDNIIDEEGVRKFFELKPSLKEPGVFETSPYDYKSILHFDSNTYQKTKTQLPITSKIESFLSSNNIDADRSTMSKIDIIEVQTNYACKQIQIPTISHEYDLEDTELRSKIEKRFEIESAFLKKDKQLTQNYLNKTFETCGMNHYWPFDYPLVQSNHKHYQLYCQKKKESLEKCLFSIECGPDDSAVCVRFFFKKTGRCVKTGSIGRKINDQMFKQGKKIKDIFG